MSDAQLVAQQWQDDVPHTPVATATQEVVEAVAAVADRMAADLQQAVREALVDRPTLAEIVREYVREYVQALIVEAVERALRT